MECVPKRGKSWDAQVGITGRRIFPNHLLKSRMLLLVTRVNLTIGPKIRHFVCLVK